MSNPIVRFFTQRCYLDKDGDAVTHWDDVCMGHETVEEAFTCQDSMQAAMLGKKTFLDDNPLNGPIIEIMQRIYEQNEMNGYKTQLRLIKITQTLEEVDPPLIVADKKIKPKKETS